MRYTNHEEIKDKILHFIDILPTTKNLREAGMQASLKDMIIKYLKDKKIIIKGKTWTSQYIAVRTPTDSEISEAIKIKQATQKKQNLQNRNKKLHKITPGTNTFKVDRFVYDAY